MEISVKADLKEATKYLTRVQRKVIPKATVRALNEAATKVQSVARKSVAKELSVRQKYIKRRFYITRARAGRLHASVTVMPGHIPTIAVMRGRQTAAGYSAAGRVRKGTFVATMKSGHRGVFIRASAAQAAGRQTRSKGSASQYKMVNGRARRLPIMTSYTGSLTKTFGRRHIRRATLVAGRRRFQARMTHHINRELAKI